MKLAELKQQLYTMAELRFRLPNGDFVPAHFHITEVGAVSKHFIDCGGTLRNETKVSMQLWEAEDYQHRLSPEKLQSILALAENKLGLGNWEVEVEYQGETICHYGLEAGNQTFELARKSTACLASDSCGTTVTPSIPTVANACCIPGVGCC